MAKQKPPKRGKSEKWESKSNQLGEYARIHDASSAVAEIKLALFFRH